MAESSNAFPFNHTGVFSIGTDKPGAPTLKAVLSVPANSSTVSGHGVLTQATNPRCMSTTRFMAWSIRSASARRSRFIPCKGAPCRRSWVRRMSLSW